jgi:adenine-specific DNA-methyltransferase
MDNLKMTSKGAIANNVEKIAALFPNCVTEVATRVESPDGTVKYESQQVVDFDKLRQELSTELVEGAAERYQFTWPDKRAVNHLANQPTTMTLRPCKEESVGKDGTPGAFDSENLYVEGDNLDVLKVLRETYLGKVKMIYIDPPYNTGNDFVYNDDFASSYEDFAESCKVRDEEGNLTFDPKANGESNGRFHTDWLNMIYPRLKVARDLLTNDGVIFISIDENEVRNLRNVCDEIFGAMNLVAQIPWQSRASIQNDTDFSINHEFIMVYAKIRRQENRRLKESNKSQWYSRDSFVCSPIPLDKSKFDNPDNDPRGLWKADPFDAPNIRPNLTYPIENPLTGIQHLPPRGRCWRTDKNQFSSALADNRIVWGADGKGRPQLKVFYDEKKAFGSIDNSWFSAEKVGTATNGTKELMKIFDGAKFFETPKPVSLLLKLLSLSNLQDDSIVLDFFSGSATTAHAVMKLNAEDEGHRKFIMVQLPEVTDEKSEARKAGYNTICEIGKERIRRAGKKIKEEAELLAQHLDIGFRVLKLAESNMQDVFYTPDKFEARDLFTMADNVKADRTAEDLLFQVMLELGIELSSTIEKKTINDVEVFNVKDGFLVATFDKNVNEETITEIAKSEPVYFVMRDASAADDNVLDNFDQLFRHYSPDTIRKIL